MVRNGTAEAAVQAFEEICRYYEQIGLLYLNNSKNNRMMKIISSTLTDNASDAKKWSKILAKYSANEEEFYLLFCILHKVAICSKDVGTLVKSVVNGISFEAAKSSQGQYDEYKTDFYLAYKKIHFILPLGDVNARTKKANAIRFFTFDFNIAITYPIYDKIIDHLELLKSDAEKRKEKFDTDCSLVLTQFKSPLNRFIAWSISILYIKMYHPYMKMMKQMENNVAFNRKLVSENFPKMLQMIENPTLFFDGDGEVFQVWSHF